MVVERRRRDREIEKEGGREGEKEREGRRKREGGKEKKRGREGEKEREGRRKRNVKMGG